MSSKDIWGVAFLSAVLLPAAGFGAGVDDANRVVTETRGSADAQRKLAARSVREEIAEALARVAKIKHMENGPEFRLLARGEFATGTGDDFLRRRTPEEILASNLSCGCGDYAAAFYGLMRRHGRKALFLDAVELSAGSLLNRDNGHTGVAVQDPATGHWILVDPTSRRVVSDDWDLSSKFYDGPLGRFLIWYLGKLEDYPAKNHDELKVLYDAALKAVPLEVLNREIVRLEFSAGPSMKRNDGSFANPRYPDFIAKWSHAYDDLGLHPTRTARVEFVDGGPGAHGTCRRTEPNLWECSVGRDSLMSESWMDWIERYVARQIDKPFKR